MNYKAFEAALAEANDVRPERRTAFRGQLRELREAGVPAVPATGTGTRTWYEFEDVWITQYALELKRGVGMLPKNIGATVAKSPRAHLYRLFKAAQQRHAGGDDIYMVDWLDDFALVPKAMVWSTMEGRSLARLLNLSEMHGRCLSAVAHAESLERQRHHPVAEGFRV